MFASKMSVAESRHQISCRLRVKGIAATIAAFGGHTKVGIGATMGPRLCMHSGSRALSVGSA
jgi:hypothetical protein